MGPILAAALVGILHVHHEPSHDSRVPFREVLEAATVVELDFLVLTEHIQPGTSGRIPAASRAGLYARPDGGQILVMVGAEYGTSEGHLLALDVAEILPIEGRPAVEAIAAIHEAGGFAVVPHPFLYGGWQAWEAPFDGIEVHNNAAALWDLMDLVLPFRLLRFAFQPEALLRRLLVRPERQLDAWEDLLVQGRDVVAFSGSEAHGNLSVLGWRLDRHEDVFRWVQTLCPAGEQTADALWTALRGGACSIRYRIHDARAGEAREVEFPSGRRELQLDDGRSVLEIQQAPAVALRRRILGPERH